MCLFREVGLLLVSDANLSSILSQHLSTTAVASWGHAWFHLKTPFPTVKMFLARLISVFSGLA